MIKRLYIKIFFVAAILGPGIVLSCQQQLIPELITDPATHSMKIIPAEPTINDEIKLVVYNDCNYNILSGITKTGNTIYIVKQFNGMMKRPCFPQNDTINIGKLPQGTYMLNYKLLDIAYTPPQVDLSLNFNLTVNQ